MKAGDVVWFNGWSHQVVYEEGLLIRIRRNARDTGRVVYRHQVVTDADHRAMRNQHHNSRAKERRRRRRKHATPR